MTRYYPTSADSFRETFDAARSASPLIDAATSPFDAETPAIHYLAGDALSGFAVTETGELRFVFSLVKGRGDDLVTAALREGASHLDCFDGYLPTLYGRHGFTETARELNWTPGDPDVVYLRLTLAV